MNLRWRKMAEKNIRLNRFRTITKKRFRLPHGYVGDFYTRYEEDIVCALVVTRDNQVVIAKQFRPGPEKIMWELPAGGVGRDTPRQAMARELLEETGYRGQIKLLARTTRDGWSSSWRYHYLVTQATKVSSAIPDPAERIEVVTLSLPAFIKILKQGRLTDAETAFRGLMVLDRLRLR